MSNKSELSPLAQEYLEWFMTPEWERDPLLQADWCRSHNVDSSSPGRWRRSGAWSESLNTQQAVSNADPGNVEKVVARLRKEALGGDVNAMRAYMQYAVGLESSEGETVRDMTDLELAKALDLAAVEVRARASV